MRSIKSALGVLFAVTALCASAQGDTFPSRPIKLLLPLSAGSGGDSIGRLLGESMAKKLGGSIYVDNKVGAGGTIGAAQAAKSPNDGYTITMGGMTSHIIAPAVYAKLPYDPVRDFSQVGRIGTAGVVVVSSNDFPARNLKELIGYSKGQAKPLQYATWGHGSTGHLCGEVIVQKAGAKLDHIPFKSSADLVTGLLGGHINLAVLDMGTATPLVKSEKIKALGICGSRSPSLPNVGTYPEQGIDFRSELSWMLLAPAGIPADVNKKLTTALKESLAEKHVSERLLELGVQPAYLPPDELRKLMQEDVATWKKVAEIADVKPN
jgi:tripartite-type tricarboxylate transporter receptor subunit TctC